MHNNNNNNYQSSLSFISVLTFGIIQQVEEYERGLIFTLGKYSSVKNPGWRLVIPIFQRMQRVDIRTKTVDVPDQEVITKDNIPIAINAVVYYKIVNVAQAILEVEDFYYAISQLAQTTMRNTIGERTLDEILQQRSEIAKKIKEELDFATDKWGIDVSRLELKDVIIPNNLKRRISKEAEAEREKRAVIIKAQGDREAAKNLAAAAQRLSEVPGAMHLRTLQSINDLSSDQSNTTIWMVPIEILEAVKGWDKTFNQKK